MAAERRRLRLLGIYWYTWMTRDEHEVQPFDYAGVVRLHGDDVERKPVSAADRSAALALEGCKRKKAGEANSCIR